MRALGCDVILSTGANAGPRSAGHLTRKLEVLDSIPGLATCIRFSFR